MIQSAYQGYIRVGATYSDPRHMIKLAIAVLLLVACLAGAAAIAGTTGAEFKPAFDWLTDSFGGYLGRAIMFGALIYGAFIAAGKQQPSLAAGAVVLGFFVMVGPNVLNGMVTATI